MLNVNTMKKVNGINSINNYIRALFIFLLIDKNINDYRKRGGKYLSILISKITL